MTRHEEDKITGKQHYKEELHQLQIELVKLQRHIIRKNDKILVILEGRDAAGKDGSIKRIIQHLSPRETRVVALGKPSDREESQWYFQRYTPYLPAAAEIVFFNRSWYNRAGVEKVMGFCTDAQYEEFFAEVTDFEGMLVRSGIHFIKVYLDISKSEQKNGWKRAKTTHSNNGKPAPLMSRQSNIGRTTVARATSCLRVPTPALHPGPLSMQTTKKSPASNSSRGY